MKTVVAVDAVPGPRETTYVDQEGTPTNGVPYESVCRRKENPKSILVIIERSVY